MRRSARTAATRVALAAALSIALSGCVLERVLDTHRQLCDASPRQVVVADAPGGGYRIEFVRPTLTRDDVVWLVGAPPTRVVAIPGGERFVYVASPSGGLPSPAGALVAELEFRDVDGVPKLVAFTPPARASALAPRALVDRAIDTICRPDISLAPPGARFDISSIPPDEFPDAARIATVLGPPHFRDGASIGYRFCLEPCDPRTRPVAQLVASPDGNGRIVRAEFAYFRYSVVVDPPGGTATVALRLP